MTRLLYHVVSRCRRIQFCGQDKGRGGFAEPLELQPDYFWARWKWCSLERSALILSMKVKDILSEAPRVCSLCARCHRHSLLSHLVRVHRHIQFLGINYSKSSPLGIDVC